MTSEGLYNTWTVAPILASLRNASYRVAQSGNKTNTELILEMVHTPL